MQALLLLFAWLAVLTTGCGSDPTPSDGSAGSGGSAGTGGSAGEGGDAPQIDYVTSLRTREDYAAVSGEGAEVKYLTLVDGRDPPALFGEASCLFQNTDKYPYHLQFLRSFPEYADLAAERYSDMILRRESRVLWGGGLKLFAATPHPVSGRAGVLVYTVYSGSTSSELLTVADIVEVDRRLKQCAEFAQSFLVFTPDGSAQIQAVRGMQDELAAQDVAVVEPAQLRPGLSAETYSEGEGYGYLEIVPEGGDAGSVGPRDVVVIDAAPPDLGLVAGLITRQPQSVASHVNLRLREKRIPSAAVPSALDNTLLAALEDSLVRISARGEQVVIEPARLEDAENFWRTRQPPLGAPRADLAVDAAAPLDALGASDAAAFGTKAANLGELSRVLPEQNRVTGFAIPFRASKDFIDQHGIDAAVQAFLDDARVRTDAAYKRERLAAVRQLIRSSELLPEFASELERAIRATYGDAGYLTRLRFRSSTNAEDLPAVSGAGLYDSRSGCLADDLDADSAGPSACLTPEHESHLRTELERRTQELTDHPERAFLIPIIEDLEQDLTQEKSAHLAVRRVWASLWNERAFDDREYYGIDHRQVFMGLAVHPAFVGEQLEAVALTGLEPEAEEPLYRVVSQVGEVGVVRPSDPTASPEILSFRRSASSLPTTISLVQSSSLVENGTGLWSDSALDELARLLFAVQDHFATEVYPEQTPLLLDIEIDVTMDGRTVFKQARPYTP